MIGRMLAQYRVLEELGRGGMGTVYLGEDTQLHRRVAIKVISGASHTQPAARARFLQEARAASALDHPNIGAIHQIGETEDGVPYLVMAHYAGETLDKRIGAGPMRVGEAVAIAAQVADGLAHAHSRGIVHRDIKPSNVLRTPDGVVKILDFGLAKVIGADSMTVTGVSIGTPAYMSPEQVRAEPVDARSDVWAVGVLVYALLLGRSPFEGENLAAVTYAILESDPLPLRKVLPRAPEALQKVVDRCLAKRPADRYADARALAADLRAVASSLAEDDAMTIADSASGARTLAIPSTPRSGGARGKRSGIWTGLAITVVASVAGVIATRGVERLWRSEPLRVAVLQPEIAAGADSTEAALASTGVITAALGQLAGLRGLAAIDASDLRGVSGPVAAGRAVAADEIVTSALEPIRDEWRVTLRRLAVADSTVRWTGTFGVARDTPASLADAVRARLASGFPSHRPRAGAASSPIAPADYEEFLKLERSFRASKGNDLPRDEMVARLEALRRRAPRYLDLHLLESQYGRYQFEARQSPEDLDRAAAAARRGAELFPADPRPVRAAFECALLAGDLRAGDSLAKVLRRVDPGGVHIDVAEARLAEKRGRTEEALEKMKRAVGREPSRAFYERLIRMEYSQGRYADARGHLEFLMAREPEYVFPRSYLAQLELLYGRPSRAESLYAELAARYPRLVYLSNLSLAQMLQGRYAESAASSRRALETNASSAAVMLNLADNQWLLGRRDSATALYRRVIATLDESSEAPGANRLIRAQCLSHLGQHSAAVALAQEALRDGGDDPEVRFVASLVFALAGERTSAIVNAGAAVKHGMQPRWFGLPWFDPLRDDPEFVAALKAPA